MKYLNPDGFSVALGTKAYRDNWEATFGEKKDEPRYACETCADTGCVVDPDVDPNRVETEGDLLKPCPLCGATDHEKIEIAGCTVTGCPEVPEGTMVAVPDTDEIRATFRSYANYIGHGPTVSIPYEGEGTPEGFCPRCGRVLDEHGGCSEPSECF